MIYPDNEIVSHHLGLDSTARNRNWTTLDLTIKKFLFPDKEKSGGWWPRADMMDPSHPLGQDGI